jgi:hypothetical protein
MWMLCGRALWPVLWCSLSSLSLPFVARSTARFPHYPQATVNGPRLEICLNSGVNSFSLSGQSFVEVHEVGVCFRSFALSLFLRPDGWILT